MADASPKMRLTLGEHCNQFSFNADTLIDVYCVKVEDEYILEGNAATENIHGGGVGSLTDDQSFYSRLEMSQNAIFTENIK
ncbi:hypothetical protein RRF57_003966 [Xylaria bambusicola]|uniref:Uncharacterized protein n=1 Tax=Xylaria bambusicola TaxID=326684 RepID=A0AAN7Z819_9PEZI